jgi:hypothetical protein
VIKTIIDKLNASCKRFNEQLCDSGKNKLETCEKETLGKRCFNKGKVWCDKCELLLNKRHLKDHKCGKSRDVLQESNFKKKFKESLIQHGKDYNKIKRELNTNKT